jgi:hypothetical protein
VGKAYPVPCSASERQGGDRGTKERGLAMATTRIPARTHTPLAVLAILVGCGADPMPGGASPAARSWMDPDAYKHTLIYAGGDEASYVLRFPDGKLGTIAQTSFGLCSDNGGDVFFTQVKRILEYAHGGKAPVATFAVDGSAYSCSVDPTTGDLAASFACRSAATRSSC